MENGAGWYNIYFLLFPKHYSQKENNNKKRDESPESNI
jgi:hypothetical protein